MGAIPIHEIQAAHEIRILGSRDLDEWDAYVERHPGATCYHLRAWKEVAREAYGFESPYLIARRGGEGPICGALPLFVVGGLVKLHLTNGLFGAYASPLGDDPAIRRSLVEEACRLTHRRGARLLVLKTLENGLDPGLERHFERRESWVIATLRLARDPEAVWLGLRDKVRNCVRKGVRAGLEIRSGAGELPRFYAVLSENMHRKGAPIYGETFLRSLQQCLGPQRSDVVTLWHQGRCVSGAFLIQHRRRVYVPFASSLPDSLWMSPNNLLYWEIIRRSCMRGMETLDFGRSVLGSGPLRFKEGWGAVVAPQPCYFYSPGSSRASFDENDPRAKLFVRGWKHLPRRLALALGPAVCRQIAGLM